MKEEKNTPFRESDNLFPFSRDVSKEIVPDFMAFDKEG